ncbi:hypothetical protein GCM10009760_14130 [Kitasatospora kazusensis]|uniref:Uncharacterized protein n=1 Tax=Kitasatospora kazusensis TaxID=407974 RepID=A0ABN2Z1U5_9ACTN
MTSTAITALRRGRAVDPGRVLTGPLCGVGLSWLEPGDGILLVAEGVEHTVYVTAGAGFVTAVAADAADSADSAADTDSAVADSDSDSDDIPLAEGTAVTLPLGGRATLTAGEAGLEYFHAVLAVRAALRTPQEGAS